MCLSVISKPRQSGGLGSWGYEATKKEVIFNGSLLNLLTFRELLTL